MDGEMGGSRPGRRPRSSPALVHHYFGAIWDDPETGPAMVGFLRRALSDQSALALPAEELAHVVAPTVERYVRGQLGAPVEQTRVQRRQDAGGKGRCADDIESQ